jgi:hypothetical protein
LWSWLEPEEFILGIDFSSFGNVADPSVWSQVHDEGVQILENLANIRVPVIAVIEGYANVHSEYTLLANMIVSGEGGDFQWSASLRRWHSTWWQYIHHLELWSRSRKGRGIFTEPTATDSAHRLWLGSGCRDRAKWKGPLASTWTRVTLSEGSGRLHVETPGYTLSNHWRRGSCGKSATGSYLKVLQQLT